MSPQYAKANKTTTQHHRMARGPRKGHENVFGSGICGDNVVPLTSAMTTSKAGCLTARLAGTTPLLGSPMPMAAACHARLAARHLWEKRRSSGKSTSTFGPPRHPARSKRCCCNSKGKSNSSGINEPQIIK